MNDTRFKQLLNLYLDNEITPGEAAELEEAITHDAHRRQTYHNYRTLHRGCSALFEKTCAHAPATHALARALRDAERRIEHPAAATAAIRQRRSWWATCGSATAIAASLALVVARMQSPDLAKANKGGGEVSPSGDEATWAAASGGGSQTPSTIVPMAKPVAMAVAPSQPASAGAPGRPGIRNGLSVPGWVQMAANENSRRGPEFGADARRMIWAIAEPVVNLPEPAINATDLDNHDRATQRAAAYEPVSAANLRGHTAALNTGGDFKAELTIYQFQR
ncbi:MAG: hypothetical protein LBK99_05885 [Opitutaceae bacterium]|jgi:hypothetical protein|nr:hypothetical protein [Opitutaceae bacterium]